MHLHTKHVAIVTLHTKEQILMRQYKTYGIVQSVTRMHCSM